MINVPFLFFIKLDGNTQLFLFLFIFLNPSLKCFILPAFKLDHPVSFALHTSLTAPSLIALGVLVSHSCTNVLFSNLIALRLSFCSFNLLIVNSLFSSFNSFNYLFNVFILSINIEYWLLNFLVLLVTHLSLRFIKLTLSPLLIHAIVLL
jgi:hypothetical protein